VLLPAFVHAQGTIDAANPAFVISYLRIAVSATVAIIRQVE
jgi:hypothetical protein